MAAVGSGNSLYLVRHGEALPPQANGERPLSPAGIEAIRRIASLAKLSGVWASEIRHSGILRARQTAEILARGLSPSVPVIASEGLRPEDPVVPIGEMLLQESESIILVSHLPFLALLVNHLVSAREDRDAVTFYPGTLVELRNSGTCWGIVKVINP